MNLGLEKKVALVTGGGSGIGAGICEALAQEGVDVAINYIVDKENVDKYAIELSNKYKINAKSFYADVSKPGDLDKMIVEINDIYNRIDILVNNAGIWPTENVFEMSDENWLKVININLNGPFLLSKRVAKYMIDKNIKGNIVCISSKSSFQYNTPGHAHYATAKAGINMMVRTLAREFASFGIRVNGIAPGMVRTPINEDKWADPENVKYYNERIPVGRLAMPIEIGYGVSFLVSDKAFNIDGAILDMTGGMMI